MGFISDLHSKWKSLPASQKAKIIIEGLCDIGSCFLVQTMTRNFYKANNCGLIKRMTIGTTATGLGMWAGAVASKQFEGLIDLACRAPEKEDDDDE